MLNSLLSKVQPKRYKLIYNSGLLLLFIVLLVLPQVSGLYYVRMLSILFIYIMLGIGLNIAMGYCGMRHFAAAAFFACGAYGSAVSIVTWNVPFFVSLLIGIVVACLVSLVLSLSAIKVKNHYLALVSMGILIIVELILINWLSVTRGPEGFFVPRWIIFGIAPNPIGRYYILFVFALLCFIFQHNIVKSHWGRDLRAIANNEIAAGGMGINYRSYRIYAMFLSAALSGVAGAVFANFSGFISPDSFTFNFTVFVLLIVILGGPGTLIGPVIGAAVVTLLPELFNAAPDLRQIVYGVLLIFVVQVLPRGIAGTIKRRFHEIDDNTYVKPGEKVGTEDITSRYTASVSRKGDNILSVKGLTRQFGGLTAVDKLDMEIRRGSIHSLIGPNGAGKTTSVNMITGVDTPTAGTVIYNGEDITGLSMWNLARKGISRTYQHVQLFNDLSVIDNVAVGTRLRYKYNFFHSVFHSPFMRKKERDLYHEALEYLSLFGIESKMNDEPESLSAGQQKLLEVARAHCMKPELLVLDEPCAGLTETEILDFSNLVKSIRDTGISILLIEHHMSFVMDISDDITVLDYGKKIAEGVPADIVKNPIVRKAYLGDDDVNS